jgi:Domain of unknown function (DUF1814).
MKKIATLPENDRRDLFQNVSQKMKTTPAVVEKDFWVCWILDYLFRQSRLKNHLVFKGGTSLSKCYGLIDRFSEDVDLILDWRVLGYKTSELWDEKSFSKQNKLNHEIKKESHLFLDKIQSDLEINLKNELGDDIRCYIDQTDADPAIRFAYPKSFSDKFILPEIRLEISALAAWTPSENIIISPYAADYYPDLFSQQNTKILTAPCERTFWEKITILHREAQRLDDSIPERYSRHYYDIYCIASSDFKEKAMENIELLEKVAAFKEKFQPQSWAKYNEAKRGTLKLIPPEQNLKHLEKDYTQMQNMLFGEKPTFSEILETIKQLESEINH